MLDLGFIQCGRHHELIQTKHQKAFTLDESVCTEKQACGMKAQPGKSLYIVNAGEFHEI